MTKEEKKYYKKLRKYRTSLLRFVWLVITRKMPMKLAIQIYKNPIEIMMNKGNIEKEELLTTFAGLKIIKVSQGFKKNEYHFLFTTPKETFLWTQFKTKKNIKI